MVGRRSFPFGTAQPGRCYVSFGGRFFLLVGKGQMMVDLRRERQFLEESNMGQCEVSQESKQSLIKRLTIIQCDHDVGHIL